MKEKDKIIEAEFLNLLTMYRFREITIKMICEAAHINRSTFYAYYLDKYDLLDRMIDLHLNNINDIVNDTIDQLQDVDDKQTLIKDYLSNLFHYIYDHQQFFKVLMTMHPAQNFTQKLIQTLRNSYLRAIENQNVKEPEYFVNYTLGGQFGTLFFWLQNDCDESPDNIADIVYRNLLKLNR